MDSQIQLYSHPVIHISNYVTVQLTERNYLLWKTQFESFLSGQNLLGFVNGAIKPPPAVNTLTQINGLTTEVQNPDYQAWQRSDQVVRAWLLGSLSEDILREVVHTITAQEVWTALAQHFNKVSSSRLFKLQRKLQTIEKLDKSMEDYVREIKRICEQLASIGNPVSQKMKIFAALHDLGRDYEPIKTSIEGSMDLHPPPTFESVIPRLTGFADRMAGYNAGNEVSPHLAFNITTTNGSHYYSSQGRGNGKPGNNNKGRLNFTTKGRGFHQQISSGSSGGDRIICQICGKPGHPALKCWHRFNNSYQHEELPSALAALRITDVTETAGHDWFTDSAATAHVTNSTNRLQQSQPYSGSDAVMVGNGEFLPITHTGSTSLQSTSGNLPLTDVLVCPDINKSLISVSKLTSDYPCCVEFDCDTVRITDKATKRLLTMGHHNKGLYMLKNHSPLEVYYSSRQQAASDAVWHRRLGHPNAQILQHLSTTKAISVNKNTKMVCEACQLGKSLKLPFSASSFVASRPLQRIHCDLWGPSPIMSVQGFRYYAVLIDNYSRFSWFYPLKLKSDFALIFPVFQAMVENQFQ